VGRLPLLFHYRHQHIARFFKHSQMSSRIFKTFHIKEIMRLSKTLL
jgi:hypothetical protein